MRISEFDLDPNLLAKINRLDGIVSSFDPNSTDGFVSYGKDGFYFKKTNDTFLKRIFTEDEIVDLDASLYSSKKNVMTTSLKDLRSDKSVVNMAAKKFLYEVPFTFKREFEGKIILTKAFPEGIAVLDDTGLLYYNDVSVQLHKGITETFNLASKLDIHGYVDLAMLDPKTILVATRSFGIYRVSLEDNSIELIVSLDAVRNIEITHYGQLFVTTDYFCGIYELETGLSIEKFNNIYNARQIPHKIVKTNTGLFVLGSPAGLNNLDNMIHTWVLDKAGVSYNVKDNMVERNPVNNKYQPLFFKTDGKYFYIAGMYADKIFVWSYDSSFRLHEEIIDCISATFFDGFLATERGYAILSKEDLYLVKDNIVEEHLKFDVPCKDIKLCNNEIYAFADKSLVKFELLTFVSEDDVLKYDIMDATEKCNNIDIYVKGATRSERITLIDKDTKNEIVPSYYIVYNGNNSVIKLMNCQAKRIELDITVNPTSSLEGIIVKRNRMFLR